MSNTHTKRMARREFRAWSGGFPPDSPEQIEVFLQTAMPTDWDYGVVHEWLTEWLEEQ